MEDGENELPDLLPKREKQRPLWVRLLCVGGAIVLFVAGVVFWLMPVITGIPFYIAGAILLAAASERAREWVNHLERKLPSRFRLKLRKGMQKIPIKSVKRMAAASQGKEMRDEDKVRGSA